MGVTKFENLIVWERSQDFAIKIYSFFSFNKDYGFRDQITRAAVSISNNIAEGFERESSKEFARYLKIAQASNGEVRSMLYLSPKLKYLKGEEARKLIYQSNEISKMLFSLRRSVLENGSKRDTSS